MSEHSTHGAQDFPAHRVCQTADNSIEISSTAALDSNSTAQDSQSASFTQTMDALKRAVYSRISFYQASFAVVSAEISLAKQALVNTLFFTLLSALLAMTTWGVIIWMVFLGLTLLGFTPIAAAVTLLSINAIALGVALRQTHKNAEYITLRESSHLLFSENERTKGKE